MIAQVIALSLWAGFQDPPAEYRPQVWWWSGALRTAPREAITRDLEGLKSQGVSGFHIYGGVGGNDPQWLKGAAFALEEAARIGLDAGLVIGAAGCGASCTSDDFAEKRLVCSRRKIKGGSDVSVELPQGSAKNASKSYWDVGLYAVQGTRVEQLPIGSHTWNAPAGEWELMRIGFVSVRTGWMGCYIDHMSKEAFDAHWRNTVEPILSVTSEAGRKAVKSVLCDSWEGGDETWTQRFPEEFRARRGYEIYPWLPALFGATVQSVPLNARFLRDYRQTISELIAENHYGYQKEVANRHGMKSIAEACGPHQVYCDALPSQGRCDVSMGEFWMPSNHRKKLVQRYLARDSASAAHVYGINEVLAESFTTINTWWTESPQNLKPCGDRGFCEGVNRICWHGSSLSPSLTDKPGIVRNVAQHYNPQNTWFAQSREFNLYLARCGWMLRQGRFHADALVWRGDNIGQLVGMKLPEDGLGLGYDYDQCPTELLMKARVENGEIVLPSGMRYKVLLLSERNKAWTKRLCWGPDGPFAPVPLALTEEMAEKLAQLAKSGAVIAGNKPCGPSSMLDDRVKCHAAFDALWGKNGLAIATTNQSEIAKRLKLLQDFECTNAQLCWTHRTLPEGELYFISNQEAKPVKAQCIFRQQTTAVELWNAVTVTRTPAEFRLQGGRAVGEVELPAYGSLFVLFGKTGAKKSSVPKHEMAIDSAWKVQFDPAWGGPKEAQDWSVLADWTKSDLAGVKYYSGTAVYRTTFAAKKNGRTWIDLGEVQVIADVSVNGKHCGTAWAIPFRLEITDALKDGINVLEIRVANNWPNRLIGDAALPKEKRFTKTNHDPYKPGDALHSSGLLGQVRLLY